MDVSRSHVEMQNGQTSASGGKYLRITEAKNHTIRKYLETLQESASKYRHQNIGNPQERASINQSDSFTRLLKDVDIDQTIAEAHVYPTINDLATHPPKRRRLTLDAVTSQKVCGVCEDNNRSLRKYYQNLIDISTKFKQQNGNDPRERPLIQST